MNDPSRPYRSTLRDEQSRATRRRIVHAGAELFIGRGYGATTIDAIADHAEVSRRTVFTSVGSKADILKLAFDWTLAGDDEPIAIADRPIVRELMQATDPVEVLRLWIAMNATINERITPLYLVLVAVADADPDVATLLNTTDQQRLEGALHITHRINELDGLNPTLTIDEAAAIIDVLIDPTIYRRFTTVHRWSLDTYTTHLQHIATTSILRRPPS